ncbi:MAG: L,D-transpeptidase family protein, partial [Verrucomicrobiales bacterium]
LLLARGAEVDAPFRRPVREEFLNRIETQGVAKWALLKTSRVTPLMMAVDRGDTDMVRTLLARGASRKITTRFGRNRMWPLSFATRRADVEMMQLLLGKEPSLTDRWIKVDLSEQRAWVYESGGKMLYTTRISSGKKGYRTPTGEFVITNKYRDWTSTIYDSHMPWFQRLSSSDFGFHEGYVPGYPASHGCMRVPRGAAYKLYKLTRLGDFVKIVP